MEKVYAIVESNFEYDDERYNSNEGEKTRTVFRRKEKAEEERDRLSYEFYRDNDLSLFVYETSDFVSDAGERILIEMIPMLGVHLEPELSEDLLKGDYQVGQLTSFFELAMNHVSRESLESLLKEILFKPYHVREFILND